MQSSSLGRTLCVARVLLCALGAVVFSGCDTQPRHFAGVQLVAGGVPRAAEESFRRYGCTSCHVIPGIRGADGMVGPTLEGWSSRRFVGGVAPNNPDRLIAFIQNPHSVNPASAMPNVGATETDARHMAAYLYTLR